MTLAQVQGTAALICFLMATWAGLIIAMALLIPNATGKAEAILSVSPIRSFFIGLLMLIPATIMIGILRVPSPAVKLVGFVGLVAIGAALSIGAAGIAHRMGRRIGELSQSRTNFSALVSGAVVFSLAVGFPFIGWFLFLPISIIVSLGTGTTALIRSIQRVSPPTSPMRPEYDLEQRGAI